MRVVDVMTIVTMSLDGYIARHDNTTGRLFNCLER
jgi:hypothetical protein